MAISIRHFLLEAYMNRVILSVPLAFLLVSTSVRSDTSAAGNQGSNESDAFTTTYDYVVHFYPRWFTYNQENFTATNRLIGPIRMTPAYSIVVAPNDDTLYVSSFMDLTDDPIILSIPSTNVNYSLLILDPYGDVLSDLAITATMQGALYGLAGPNFTGTLPPGVNPV